MLLLRHTSDAMMCNRQTQQANDRRWQQGDDASSAEANHCLGHAKDGTAEAATRQADLCPHSSSLHAEFGPRRHNQLVLTPSLYREVHDDEYTPSSYRAGDDDNDDAHDDDVADDDDDISISSQHHHCTALSRWGRARRCRRVSTSSRARRGRARPSRR